MNKKEKILALPDASFIQWCIVICPILNEHYDFIKNNIELFKDLVRKNYQEKLKIETIPKKEIMKTKNFLDIQNTFGTKIACVKVDYLRKIGYETFEEWLKDDKNMYVGRYGRIFIGKGEEKRVFTYGGSIFGNPYKVSDDLNIDECLMKFYEHIKGNKELYGKLDMIKGKTIGCWCGINDKCHAKVLINLLKEKENEVNKI